MCSEPKQMRERCQASIAVLTKDEIPPAMKVVEMADMLINLHRRITLLEGESLQSLDEVPQR